MSDALRPAEANELGGVDLMRIPGWAWFGRIPRVARFFVVLALLDIVVRLIGLMGPPAFVEYGPPEPLAPPMGILPRVLWIALPGVILIRRPDAGRAIPWIFRGALVLSLGTLAAEPITRLLWPAVLEPFPAFVVGQAVSTAGLIVAWLMLARGFEALGPRHSSPAGRALATFVAAAFAFGAAINVAARSPYPIGTASPDFDPVSFALSALPVLESLATGAALWAVSQGLADRRRPIRATRLGAAAAVMWGLAVLMGSLGTVWFLLIRPLPDFSEGLYALELVVEWMTTAIAPAMLVAAIAIGLVDRDQPDRTDLAADEPDPRRAGAVGR